MKELLKINASDLHRAMNCAGSPRFEDLIKLPRTEDADEGIVFDELIQLMIKGRTAEFSSKGKVFTKEMVRHANRLFPHINISAEIQYDCTWTTQSGVLIPCRLDMFWIEQETNTLVVPDIKYGYGIVEAEKNWQLIAYAIGVVLKLGRAFKSVKLGIMQPRPFHEEGIVRWWEITYKELTELKAQIEKRTQEMKDGLASLSTGDHCTYCKAGDSGVCPAKRRAFYNAVDVVMTDFKQDYLSEEQISELLKLLERVGDIFKIQKKSLEELAKIRIKEGKGIPDFTTVDSFGHRQWNPGITIESLKALTGCDPTEVSMMTPTEFENTYSVPEILINGLTKRPLKGTVLKQIDAGKIADKIFNQKEGK